MKYLLFTFLLFAAFVGYGFAQNNLPTYEELFSLPKPIEITGKVVAVYDGDTITVLDENKKQYKIRFNGIDAPEIKQDFGTRAKENLSNLVFGKQVKVLYDKVDKYQRIVGTVFVEGKDANLAQVQAGMAWHYKKYQDEQKEADRKLYAEAETKAKTAKIGLWSQPEPTPPWDWRGGVNNANLAGVPAGAIIGNGNSRIYHVPGCSTYAKVSAKNRVIFKTEEEAIAKGYRISGGCTSNLPVENRPKPTPPPSAASTTEKKYIRGARGGCYYLSASGKKVYVDRGLCN